MVAIAKLEHPVHTYVKKGYNLILEEDEELDENEVNYLFYFFLIFLKFPKNLKFFKILTFFKKNQGILHLLFSIHQNLRTYSPSIPLEGLGTDIFHFKFIILINY